MCQPDYVDDGGLLVVTTELFISRVDNTNLGEYGFVPFAEIIEGFEGMSICSAQTSPWGDTQPCSIVRLMRISSRLRIIF